MGSCNCMISHIKKESHELVLVIEKKKSEEINEESSPVEQDYHHRRNRIFNFLDDNDPSTEEYISLI